MFCYLPRLGLSPVCWLEGHLELSRAAGDEVGGLVLVTERVPAHHDRLGPPCIVVVGTFASVVHLILTITNWTGLGVELR